MSAVAKQAEQQIAAAERWKPAPPDPEGLQRLLIQMERPLIDAEVRARLVRLLQLNDEGHVQFVITTIAESEGNEDALVEPIVSAVSSVMKRHPEWPARGGEWLEAFDAIPLAKLLQDFRDLDALTDREIADYYVTALHRRLARRFAEMDAPSAPVTANRISGARKAIEQGLALLQVKGPDTTSLISTVARDRFGLDGSQCGKVLNAARVYGDRIWLVEKLSRDALFTLASPSLPASARESVERRLCGGEVVRAPEIKRLRFI